MATFRDSPKPGMPEALQIAAARSRVEVELHDLEVEGEIPRQIDGAFYRLSSDRQYPSRFEHDEWFNEDGMVSMFRIKDGRVDLKHRYVHTARWQAEHAAGRSLFGLYRNPFTDEPAVQNINRTLANTAPVVHAGKLFALKEDGLPHAMDPRTLATIGPWNFHQTLQNATFTAHPRLDPQTGQMIAFGYAGQGLFSRDVMYYDIDRQGRVSRTVAFEVPYYNMMHDVGVSRNFVVWPIVPIVGAGAEGLKKGWKHYGWDPNLPMYLAVLPRDGDARDLRWFIGPNQFVSHLMNTFDDESGLHMDGSRADGNCFPFFPEFGKPFDPGRCNPRLTRYTVQYSQGGKTPETATPFVTRQLSDYVGEFPRSDDRYQMQPYRHGWQLSFTGARTSFAHVDLAEGKTTVFEAPADTPLQEPCFIPRAPDAPEGDGYIIQVATRSRENRTDVFLFEATRIDRGPIATIKLPLRLRSGWHGCWADASACGL